MIQRKKLKIGIMGAMPEEIASLILGLEERSEETFADRTYHQGRLFNIDVVAVFSRWGKVAAAATAVTLIAKYDVDLIIFTGVAGALDPTLNVGDVVISAHLFQHDMDARPFFDKHHIPLTGTKLFRTHPTLAETAHTAVNEFLLAIGASIPVEKLTEFGITSPKVVIGTIASGDKFVSDPVEAAAIRAVENALAVEMEGAAVGQICDEHKLPHIVIRTISDKADHSAPVDFPKFVATVASAYAKGMIQNLFTKPTFFAAIEAAKRHGAFQLTED